MNRTVVALSLVALVCMALPAMASPIAINNAGFEDNAPASTDAQFGNSLVGWTVGAGSAMYGGSGWYNPDSDRYVGETGAGAHNNVAWEKEWGDSSYIYQVLAETYVAGNVYTFSLDVGNAIGYEYSGTLGAGVGGQLALADGTWDTTPLTVLATQVVVAPTPGEFARGSVSYTATAADAGKPIVVAFRKMQDPVWCEYVDFDNAALAMGAVPEPATMSLLALGGLAALIRRRK